MAQYVIYTFPPELSKTKITVADCIANPSLYTSKQTYTKRSQIDADTVAFLENYLSQASASLRNDVIAEIKRVINERGWFKINTKLFSII